MIKLKTPPSCLGPLARESTAPAAQFAHALKKAEDFLRVLNPELKDLIPLEQGVYACTTNLD